MKMITWGRLCLPSLLVLASAWVVLQPQAVRAQVADLYVAAVSTPAPVDVIDLAVDENHDGMPDELQTALDQINAVYTAYLQKDGTPRTDPEAQEAVQQAEARFRDQLPYSDQTRTTQAHIAEIHLALTKNPDPATQTKLLAELQAMEVQLQSDSNFALVDQVLSRRLVNTLNAKIEAGQPKTPLPTVTPAATPSPANPAAADESALVQAAAMDQAGLWQRLANSLDRAFPTRSLWHQPSAQLGCPNARGDYVLGTRRGRA